MKLEEFCGLPLCKTCSLVLAPSGTEIGHRFRHGKHKKFKEINKLKQFKRIVCCFLPVLLPNTAVGTRPLPQSPKATSHSLALKVICQFHLRSFIDGA